MPRFFLLIAAPICFALPISATAEETQCVYPLPEDSRAVVVSDDEQNGITPPLQNNALRLSVLKHAPVLMSDIRDASWDSTGKISQGQLQPLSQVAIAGHKFFDFNTSQVDAKM